MCNIFRKKKDGLAVAVVFTLNYQTLFDSFLLFNVKLKRKVVIFKIKLCFVSVNVHLFCGYPSVFVFG